MDVEPFHTFSSLMTEDMKAIVTKPPDVLFDPSSAVPAPGFEGTRKKRKVQAEKSKQDIKSFIADLYSESSSKRFGRGLVSPSDVISCAEERLRRVKAQQVGSRSAFSYEPPKEVPRS